MLHWKAILGKRFLAAAVLAVAIAVAVPQARADEKDQVLDALFEALLAAKNAEQAGEIEKRIWQTWTVTGQALVDNAMERAVIAMNKGAHETALKYLNDVISLAPEHAEAWNKRATVYFLMDRYSESVLDIQRTLELEPRHFGALSGLGLIYAEMGRKKAAIRAMEKALAINPHMETIRSQLQDLKTQVSGKPI
jgi:tetratricopeptide (TPR) repeat protein